MRGVFEEPHALDFAKNAVHAQIREAAPSGLAGTESLGEPARFAFQTVSQRDDIWGKRSEGLIRGRPEKDERGDAHCRGDMCQTAIVRDDETSSGEALGCFPQIQATGETFGMSRQLVNLTVGSIKVVLGADDGDIVELTG